MIRSMTGYSRVSVSHEWGIVTMEISSVNHRFQDFSIRLPRELSQFESQVHSVLRRRLSRGKVRASIDVQWAPSISGCHLDMGALEGIYSELQTFRAARRIPGDPVPEMLLQLPGILIGPASSEERTQEISDCLADLAQQALDKLEEMKAEEGMHIQSDIISHLTAFESLLDAISSIWDSESKSAFADMQERIRKTIGEMNGTLDEGRLVQEVVIMADKWDVSEEIARSRSHIEKFRTILRQDESQGKKLDFLVQEMNREINTMGSKLASSELRWKVVEGKTLVERIREQVQNVE